MSHQASGQHHVTFSPSVGELTMPASQGEVGMEGEMGSRVSVKFVQDSSRFWYKPGISREQGETTTAVLLFNYMKLYAV